MSSEEIVIEVTVNGTAVQEAVPPRLLLTDLLRQRLGLTGTHVGCEHGICGACTVLIDGAPARACLTFAVQVDGGRVTTVEGLVGSDGELAPVQRAFHEAHALQCGFCTSGLLMTAHALLRDEPDPDVEQIEDALGGNLCRCTGYRNIVTAVQRAAQERTP